MLLGHTLTYKVGAATELERVLGELGETPFEPLKEEQEAVEGNY